MAKIYFSSSFVFLVLFMGCATISVRKMQNIPPENGVLMGRVVMLVNGGEELQWPSGWSERAGISIVGHTKESNISKIVSDTILMDKSIYGRKGKRDGWFLRSLPAGDYRVSAWSYSSFGGGSNTAGISIPFTIEEGRLTYLGTIVVDFGIGHPAGITWQNYTIKIKDDRINAQKLIGAKYGEDFLQKYRLSFQGNDAK